jgi:hypothetical protein
MTTQELKELGLTAAAKQLSAREEAAAKWAEAYARYGFVTPEQIDAFRDLCYREVMNGARKTLKIVGLADYPNVPPADVLAKLKEATESKLFDRFEVASIDWVVPVPDPILFGRIDGCPDSFFIAQWGEDVKVEELLAKPTKADARG